MDWTAVIASVVTSGVVGAIFEGLRRRAVAMALIKERQMAADQQARANEVTILQDIIRDVRGREDQTNDKLERMQSAFDRKMSERARDAERLQGLLTACQMEKQRLQTSEDWWKQKVETLKSQVEDLRTQVDELRG